MKSAMKKVSIIIRCYNEEKHIGRLLAGVTRQSLDDIEIIIVDSGSSDATLSIARRFPVKILKIGPSEFSFGRSLNKGCRVAKGEFIVAASAHVYPVFTDWLEKLIEPFADPDVALVYGKQRGNQNTKYAEHQIFANWFPDRSNFQQDHPFCNNANAAIRASLWKQRAYDETLTGLEDIDWSKWALESGYRIVYREDAVVIHVHNEKLLKTYNRYRREAIAFKRIFDNEKFNFKDFVILFPTNVINDFKNAFREGVFSKRWAEVVSFRLMQFWGTYRGFRRSGRLTSRLKRKFYYSNHVHGRGDLPVRYANNRLQINYDSEEYTDGTN